MATLIPRALLGAVAFVALMSAMVASPTWRATMGPAMEQLAEIDLGGRFRLPHWHPLRFLHRWNVRVLAAIEGLKAWSERAVIVQLNAITETLILLVGVPLAIALTLFELAKVVGAKAVQTVRHIDFGILIKPLYAAVRAVRAEGVRWRRMFAAKLAAIAAAAGNALRAGVGAIRAPFARIGALERKMRAYGRRLTALEKLALGSGAVALTWAALRRLGLGFLRCRNVQRTGRRVCSMDPDLLEAMLTATLLILNPISLRKLSRELEEPARLAAEGLKHLIVEFDPPSPSLSLPRRAILPR